jgi:hypothetical protein
MIEPYKSNLRFQAKALWLGKGIPLHGFFMYQDTSAAICNLGKK